ncbi:MAG: DNA-processing protein DprA [Bacillota bacterium]
MKEKYFMLALSTISGLGSVRMNKLIRFFGDARSIWNADENDLRKVSGIGSLAKKIVKQRLNINIKKLVEVLKEKDINYITLNDEKYPENLKNIYDPPPVLFYKGVLNFDYPAVSIIGSRRSTTYGRKTAERLAYELSERGITIISGMARGIDTQAHLGALKAKGRTFAVLGSGLDVIYPPENKELFQEIQENGLVLSEYPPGVDPLPGNFPQRNRIISGLSRGILVIEAARRSGSLITANLALEQGRELFALPGNINRPQSQGTNKLIRDGAVMVTSVDDIVEELYLYKNSETNKTANKTGNDKKLKTHYPELSVKEQKIINLFQNETELTIEQIIDLSNEKAGKINTILLKLELKGIISRSAGKKYSFLGLQSLLKPL